jgi:hypothetical protein
MEQSVGPSLDLSVVELSGVDHAVKTNRVPCFRRSPWVRMEVPLEVKRKRP